MKKIRGYLGVKVRGLGFGLGFIYFILNSQPTDPSCNILQTLIGQKKYEEAMSDQHPHPHKIFFKILSRKQSPEVVLYKSCSKNFWEILGKLLFRNLFCNKVESHRALLNSCFQRRI